MLMVLFLYLDENILGTKIFGQMIVTAKYQSTCVTGPQNYNWTGWYILGVITPVWRVVVTPPPPSIVDYITEIQYYNITCCITYIIGITVLLPLTTRFIFDLIPPVKSCWTKDRPQPQDVKVL